MSISIAKIKFSLNFFYVQFTQEKVETILKTRPSNYNKIGEQLFSLADRNNFYPDSYMIISFFFIIYEKVNNV